MAGCDDDDCYTVHTYANIPPENAEACCNRSCTTAVLGIFCTPINFRYILVRLLQILKITHDPQIILGLVKNFPFCTKNGGNLKFGTDTFSNQSIGGLFSLIEWIENEGLGARTFLAMQTQTHSRVGGNPDWAYMFSVCLLLLRMPREIHHLQKYHTHQEEHHVLIRNHEFIW